MQVKRADHRARASPAFRRLVAALLTASALGYGFMGWFAPGPAKEDTRSAAFLSRVAVAVNALFPRKVDAEMEITRVTALEGVLVYHYRFFNFMAADLDPGVVAGLEPRVLRTTCASAVTRDNFLKKDVTLRFAYADKAGRALTSFDVTRADCGV